MNNYNTKFSVGQRVKIIYGLFKGQSGKVIGYHPDTTRGMDQDNHNRGIKIHSGLYQVKIKQGFFSETINVEEEQILLE